MFDQEEYEAQNCPRSNSEHVLANLKVSLTKANQDCTGVIQKSNVRLQLLETRTRIAQNSKKSNIPRASGRGLL